MSTLPIIYTSGSSDSLHLYRNQIQVKVDNAKKYPTELCGFVGDSLVDSEGEEWAKRLSFSKEQYIKLGSFLNERDWIDGIIKKTRDGKWVMSWNIPQTAENKPASAKKEAVEDDGLPF